MTQFFDETMLSSIASKRDIIGTVNTLVGGIHFACSITSATHVVDSVKSSLVERRDDRITRMRLFLGVVLFNDNDWSLRSFI